MHVSTSAVQNVRSEGDEFYKEVSFRCEENYSMVPDINVTSTFSAVLSIH